MFTKVDFGCHTLFIHYLLCRDWSHGFMIIPYLTTKKDTSISEIIFSGIRLDTGEQIMEDWYETHGETFTAIYIEV